MTHFRGISHHGDARRAHLALVTGGGPSIGSGTGTGTGAAGSSHPVRTSGLQAVADVHSAQGAGATYNAAAHGASSIEGPRSRHERGVRAVAGAYSKFEDALLPMVLASGVGGESASAVRDAIMSSPALRNQAERAYSRARADRS